MPNDASLQIIEKEGIPTIVLHLKPDTRARFLIVLQVLLGNLNLSVKLGEDDIRYLFGQSGKYLRRLRREN